MYNKYKNKKSIFTLLSIIMLLGATIVLLGYVIPSYDNAKKLGASVGSASGQVVGKAIGSYKGITDGISKGKESGKADALDPDDTTESKMGNEFKKVGNLEVLEAGIKLKNMNKLGEDYAALYLMKGVAVFSVNLKNAQINSSDSDIIEIVLPPVDCEIYIDENATEKLAEYQKTKWTGSSHDGTTAFNNSATHIVDSAKNNLENYNQLIESAKQSAIRAVEIIARAAVGNKKNVTVLFGEEITNE